jgi:charged multivesicular body protein 4
MYEVAREILRTSLVSEEVIGLYRSMVSRDINPDQWDHQLKFWSTMIRRWADQASVVDFSVAELTQVLMYDHIYPPLQPSLDLLVKTGVLQSRESALSGSSLLSTITSTVLGFVFPMNPAPAAIYVFRTNLRERAERLVLTITTRPGLITDLCCTRAYLASQDPSMDTDLLCAEFGRMRRCVEKRPDGYFFPCSVFGKPSREVVDGILRIKSGIEHLRARLEKLEGCVDEELQRARAFKGQNRNEKALNCLRRKRLAEGMVVKVEGAIRQLEAALDQIETGDMNAQTAEAMRRARAVPAIDREDVERVLDEAAENAARTRELSDALQPPPLEDDPDLERELDEIAAQMPHPGRERVPVATGGF